jgi:CDP-glucose 4,6-dehydratase
MLVEAEFWRGRRVFLTGHTGFKGSWLSLWLSEMGAQVTGFALSADRQSLFRQAGVARHVRHVEGDIRDVVALEEAIAVADPEVVFHLAAQPLVRLSYDEPRETWSTNVQGTVNVLDACRRLASLRGIVAVTSDKCYENREWVWPYRESDPMGGHDPYSASKGAAELVVASYRRSFFELGPLLASVRAGNVIGGGDWARDRLVPDIVRSLLDEKAVRIRSPHAIRPWQHVLEALGGYILIAQHMLSGNRRMAEAWNFGPAEHDVKSVAWIVSRMIESWGAGSVEADDAPKPHEASLLSLDCSKARCALGWNPALDVGQAIDWIVDWHKNVSANGDAFAMCRRQIAAYQAKINRVLS